MPRRPQVRPRGGLRVKPASSSKQTHPSQAARALLPPPRSPPSRRQRPARHAPRTAARAQRRRTALLPGLMSLIGRLAAHPQLPSDLRRLDPFAEQRGSLQAHGLTALTCLRGQPAPIRISHARRSTAAGDRPSAKRQIHHPKELMSVVDVGAAQDVVGLVDGAVVGDLVVAGIHGVGDRGARVRRSAGVSGHGLHRSRLRDPGGPRSFTQNEAGTGTGMRDALDVSERTPAPASAGLVRPAGAPRRPHRTGPSHRSGVTGGRRRSGRWPGAMAGRPGPVRCRRGRAGPARSGRSGRPVRRCRRGGGRGCRGR